MDNKRKIIGHFGGISFMVDNEADEKAFAPMFPNGAEFNGGAHPLEQAKGRANNFNPVTDTPFGKKSIFYIPGMFLKSDFTFDETIEDTGPEVAALGFTPTNGPGPEPNSPIDLWVTFLAFDFEANLERFLSGGTTPEYNNTIYNFLEDKASVMPKQMVCAYVKKTAFSSSPVPVFRFSNGLCKYIKSLTADNSSTIDLYERVDKWVNKLNQLGLTNEDFNYSSQQLEDAFEIALPHDINTTLSRMPKSTDTKGKKKQYHDNYTLLKSMAENPGDPQTENAIRVLCKIAIELDTDVLQSYNQQADVRYNTAYPNRKLTANDFYHMARRLASLSKEIRKFQNGDFKTADDVVSFVNLNLVDPSALGVETKFVINYPFEKLSYQRRKEMVLLFLDGKKELSFSGFLDGATWDSSRKVSAGDIVYNLFITGGEADRKKLVHELEAETKIFDLLNQADDSDFLFNITAVIANEGLKQSPIANNPSLQADLMKQGNFIYFDITLFKDQTENLKKKSKKIELVNNGFYNISGEADPGLLELTADYKQKYISAKTLFNPLELIVLFAEDDINTQVIKLKKGDGVILPACVVYLLFKEDTNRAVNFLVALTTTVIFLPFGITGLIATIRAANTLGIIVAAADIAVDAAYITYSLPNVQNSELQEDLEWINGVAAIYGLARLSYALKDVKGVQLTKDLYQAFKELAKEADAFIKKLPYKVVVGIINKLGKDAQYIVLDKLLVAFASDGKILFKMNAEGIIVEMKLITTADNYSIITEIKDAKIKVEKLDGKVFEEHIQLSKLTVDNKPVLKLTTPFKEGKERPAEIINQFFERSKETPPCMPKTTAKDIYLKEGNSFYVVEYARQTKPGDFAALEPIYTIRDLRNKLSVLEEWKSVERGQLVIRKYVIKAGQKIPVRKSIIGSQDEIVNGVTKHYKGGVWQYNFLEKYKGERGEINTWEHLFSEEISFRKPLK